MTLLGIDFGERRIGIATGNAQFGITTPLVTIENDCGSPQKILDVINQYRISKIVMGLPLMRDGNKSFLCETIERYGKMLEEESGVPVVFHNEYLSSNEAETHIREKMKVKDAKKIKELIDKVAASMILEEYIRGTR